MLNTFLTLKIDQKALSEVGFEPTPTFVDQNAHSVRVKSSALESGALDRSAILTCEMCTIIQQFSTILAKKKFKNLNVPRTLQYYC